MYRTIGASSRLVRPRRFSAKITSFFAPLATYRFQPKCHALLWLNVAQLRPSSSATSSSSLEIRSLSSWICASRASAWEVIPFTTTTWLLPGVNWMDKVRISLYKSHKLESWLSWHGFARLSTIVTCKFKLPYRILSLGAPSCPSASSYCSLSQRLFWSACPTGPVGECNSWTKEKTSTLSIQERLCRFQLLS